VKGLLTELAAADLQYNLRRPGHDGISAWCGSACVRRGRAPRHLLGFLHFPWLCFFDGPGSFFVSPSAQFSFAPVGASSYTSAPVTQGSATQSQVASAVAHAKLLTPELGKGRLDVVQALTAGRAMWPYARANAVPASCATDDVDWSEVP